MLDSGVRESCEGLRQLTGGYRPIGADNPGLFRKDAVDYVAFYAPGCLVVVDPTEADWFQAAMGSAASGADAPPGPDWAADLRHYAQEAVARSTGLKDGPFQPECLTLYLNTECNLRCSYCHTDPTVQEAERLDLETVAAAAEVVASSCRTRGMPFTIVFHGGGEPTLHRDRVDELLDLLERVAGEYELEPFRYIATNGLLNEDKVVWLARRFDLIGLSCDGPADIHDRQRPRWDGRPSLPIIRRTGRILSEEGCPLHLRTTITPGSLHRQVEIADYICTHFSPDEIHFEPVYLGGRTRLDEGLQAGHAEDYASGYLAARAMARAQGVRLLTSGTRLGQIHGPYCHVYRHTLNLVPGGVATACFKLTTAQQVVEAGAAIGQREPAAGGFALDAQRVRALQLSLDVERDECGACFNRYHCARECPDRCPLEGTAARQADQGPGFRCRAQKAISAGILHEAAEHLWAQVRGGEVLGPHGTTSL